MMACRSCDELCRMTPETNDSQLISNRSVWEFGSPLPEVVDEVGILLPQFVVGEARDRRRWPLRTCCFSFELLGDVRLDRLLVDPGALRDLPDPCSHVCIRLGLHLAKQTQRTLADVRVAAAYGTCLDAHLDPGVRRLHESALGWRALVQHPQGVS